MQESLFPLSHDEMSNCEQFPLQDGALWYFRHWLTPSQATLYFNRIHIETAWQQSTLRLASRSVKIPRLNAWYGNHGAHYRYSGTAFTPLPWSRSLAALKTRVQNQQINNSQPFFYNSALANLYRDGADSVAWHADDEKELGPSPVIASVSLGATRRFLLKRRDGSHRISLELEHGSLLVMLPPLQTHWLHCLPKTKEKLSARINVTFRHVIVP